MRAFGVLAAVVAAVVPAALGLGHLRGLEYKTYKGHQVVRVFVDNEAARKALMAELEGHVEMGDWDVWEDHVDSTDIRIDPASIPVVHEILERRRLNSKNLMSDVFNHCDGHIRDASAKNLLPEWDSEMDGFFEDYRVLADQYKFIHSLARDFPNKVKIIHLGKSTEGQDIIGLQIAENIDNWGSKKGIMIAGGIHCREWVAHTTALFIAHKLASEAHPELLKFDWTIVPNVNPDGYKYTWETDRFWRKTRSNVGGCAGGDHFSADPLSSPAHSDAGADANRNWNYHWKDTDSHGYAQLMGEPCSNVYAGSKAFSEPEPRSLAKYMKQHKNIVAYIDYHSYAQALLPPWGYKEEMPMDSIAQGAMCKDMVAAAHRENHHRAYRWGPNIFPNDPGTGPDYAYGEEGIVATMTIELPDTGTFGFCLPRAEIVPVGKEQFAMMTAMAKYIDQHGDAVPRRDQGGEREGGVLTIAELN